MLPVDELKAFFHIRKLPGERAGRFQTLGGFTMAHLKRVPAVGDRFECCGYSFEVVEMEGRRVRKVLIKKIGEQPRIVHVELEKLQFPIPGPGPEQALFADCPTYFSRLYKTTESF